MPSFFLLRAPIHHSFTFNLRFLTFRGFVSLKLCVGFSIFDSVTFLLKFIFLSNKMHGVFDFIIPFKIKMIKQPQIVLLAELWFLSCNKNFKSSVISAWVGAL